MKISQILVYLVLFPFILFGQKEKYFSDVREIWENGNKKIELILNSSLTPIEYFSFTRSGEIINNIKFDSISGSPNGIYNNGQFKGEYKLGKLNCNQCVLYLNSSNEKMKYSGGRVIDGIIDGKFIVTEMTDIFSSKEWSISQRSNIINIYGCLLYTSPSPRA